MAATLFLSMKPGLLAFLDGAQTWANQHHTVLLCVGIGSTILSVAGLTLVPYLITRLPVDYFARIAEEPELGQEAPRQHWLRVVLRNALGIPLLVLGILMVPLPGPGWIVILLALGLLDFPAKRRLVREILRRPAILQSVNWLRRKSGRPEMLPPR